MTTVSENQFSVNALREVARPIMQMTDVLGLMRDCVAVAVVDDGNVFIAQAKRKGSRLQSNRTDIAHGSREHSGFVKGKTPIVILLSRHEYLMRVVDVPGANPVDICSMVRLEVESTLPNDYGAAEIGFRPIVGAGKGYNRYEVYVAKSAEIGRKLTRLAELGLKTTAVYPSALAWKAVLSERAEASNLCVAPWDQHRLEAASLGTAGAMSIRTVENGMRPSSAISDGLAECIRSRLGSSGTSDSMLNVDWLGDGLPAEGIGGQVAFHARQQPVSTVDDDEWKQFRDRPLPLVLALSLMSARSGETFAATANLLPQSIIADRRRTMAARKCLMTIAMTIVGLGLFYTALQVQILRYQTVLNATSNQVQSVKRDGEHIGRQVEELKAIRSIRASRHYLHDLLRGLHDATPEGVTYSQVSLSEDGRVTLRGQAESLSLPFLLPEKLESQPMFRNVLLSDAGQTKKGGGTVTEFRIDCELTPGK